MDGGARLFLINTEISLREFESNLLIAVEAARRGHYSIIFDQRELPLLVRRAFPTGAVLHTKSLHPEPSMMQTLEKAAQKGLKITSIEHEHGLLAETYDEMLEKRYSDRALEIASGVFTWGEWDRKALVDRFPTQAAKIIQGGAARIDTWSPAFSKLARSAQRIINGPYVLVSSKLVINRHYHLRDVMRGLRQNKDNSYWVQFVLSMTKRVARSAELFGYYCELLDILCSTFPHVTFVVRPHPTEDVNAWKVAAPSMPNLRVIREGSLTSWVHGADAVIHTGCSSAFEASVAGKTVISYIPASMATEGLRNRADQLGLSVGKPSEVVSILHERFRLSRKGGSDDMTEHPAWLKKRLEIRHKHYNCETVVDTWGHLGTPLSKATRWRAMFFTSLFAWAGYVRRAARLSLKFEDYTLDKFQSMKSKDVQMASNLLAEVLKSETLPRVRRLAPGAWLVGPNGKVVES